MALIDTESFDTLITDLTDTASAVIAGLFPLSLVLGILIAFVRWGIAGIVGAFRFIESPYEEK